MATATPWPEAEVWPTASHVVMLGHATPSSPAPGPCVPGTVWALPGVPLVMATTTPWPDELPPTASQRVAVGQATPKRSTVPGTAWGAPAAPSMMGTTTPWLEAELSPTAMHVAALAQATPASN